VVLCLVQNQPALQAQTLPGSLVDRIVEAFPEYEHLAQIHRQA
jgi:hypothetical protein